MMHGQRCPVCEGEAHFGVCDCGASDEARMAAALASVKKQLAQAIEVSSQLDARIEALEKALAAGPGDDRPKV